MARERHTDIQSYKSVNGVPFGYQENFLNENTHVSLPMFSPGLESDIFEQEGLETSIPGSKKQCVLDYVHYSLAMSKSTRQALFSAANINQKQFRKVKRIGFAFDSRIPAECQLGENAYIGPEDRSHLTMRSNIAWGKNFLEAKMASDQSNCFTNVSLQHQNFNQDEWRLPEDHVKYFSDDCNDRISVITGPVFTDRDRSLRFRENGKYSYAPVPGGYYKVVAYLAKKSLLRGDECALRCQAFVVYQDKDALKDKMGRNRGKVTQYQVSLTEVSDLTGLIFDSKLYESNPLKYETEDGGPEAFAVDFSKAGTSKFSITSRESIKELNAKSLRSKH